MNDIKKVLIAAICVVLVVAIAAGVSIGVLAGTVNGLKDTVAELQQANEAQESLNASMKAEIEAAKNNEDLVTAAEFEAKLAEALGTQTQTMQALITTAVKNQIDELGVEGLTEAQVQEIIDAAVANCLTEDDIDAIIADADTGLTTAEVKKLINNATAGYLTYAQIMNMIDDADYDLRAYLEGEMADLKEYLEALVSGVQDGLTTEIIIYAEDAVNGVYTIDSDVIANLVNADLSVVALCEDDDWSEIAVVIDDEITKSFNLSITTNVKEVVLGAETVRVSVGKDVETWAIIDGKIKYAFTECGATVTISGKGAVPDRKFDENSTLVSAVIEEGITAIGNRSFRRCYNLTYVTLPESLETIDEAAFQTCTALTSIIIPEGVTSIGNQAFYGAGLTSIELPESLMTIAASGIRATNLNVITLPKSVTSIGQFAFRDSESLEYVYILCEDADAFTMAGDAFSNMADPYPDMTIFVANDAMKNKVESSLTGDTDFITVKLIQKVDADPNTFADAMKNAEDGAIVNLEAGNYTMPQISGLKDKTLTISGTKDTVVDISAIPTNGFQGYSGTTLVFDGVTVNCATTIYKGFTHAKSLTYKNCQINGEQYLYADTVTFENCDFNSKDAEHSVCTYGAEKVTFTGCNFTYADRAVNVYYDNGTGSVNVSFDGCTFTTNSTTSKGAVEINSSVFPKGAKVSFVDCTAPANGDMVGISGWDSANGAYATVTVDGVVITVNQWEK